MDNDRYYFPVVVELISIGGSKKVLNFRIENEEVHQPLKGKFAETGTKNHLWQFYEDVRQKMLPQAWFANNKSTMNRYYQFGAKISSTIVLPKYGWWFKGKNQYMIWLDIRKKDMDIELDQRKSTQFVNQVYEIVRNEFVGYNVSKENKENAIYARIYLHYPEKVSIEDLYIAAQYGKLVKWSKEIMIRFRAVTIDKMAEISLQLEN